MFRATEVKTHDFFKEIDWKLVELLKVLFDFGRDCYYVL